MIMVSNKNIQNKGQLMISTVKCSFVSIIVGILILLVLPGLASATATPDMHDNDSIEVDLYTMISYCVQWINENEEVFSSTLTNPIGNETILTTVHPNNFVYFVLSNGEIIDYKINEEIPGATFEIEMDQDTFNDFFYVENSNVEVFNRYWLSGSIVIHEINVSDVNDSNADNSDVDDSDVDDSNVDDSNVDDSDVDDSDVNDSNADDDFEKDDSGTMISNWINEMIKILRELLKMNLSRHGS